MKQLFLIGKEASSGTIYLLDNHEETRLPYFKTFGDKDATIVCTHSFYLKFRNYLLNYPDVIVITQIPENIDYKPKKMSLTEFMESGLFTDTNKVTLVTNSVFGFMNDVKFDTIYVLGNGSLGANDIENKDVKDKYFKEIEMLKGYQRTDVIMFEEDGKRYTKLTYEPL